MAASVRAGKWCACCSVDPRGRTSVVVAAAALSSSRVRASKVRSNCAIAMTPSRHVLDLLALEEHRDRFPQCADAFGRGHRSQDETCLRAHLDAGPEPAVPESVGRALGGGEERLVVRQARLDQQLEFTYDVESAEGQIGTDDDLAAARSEAPNP